MRVALWQVLLVLLLGLSGTSRASDCVRASVSTDPGYVDETGQPVFRVAFHNLCGAPRTLYWCAEHPVAPVPPQLACARSASFAPAEPRHALGQRKEFVWFLPRGTRIRYRDCAADELPTLGLECISER